MRLALQLMINWRFGEILWNSNGSICIGPNWSANSVMGGRDDANTNVRLAAHYIPKRENFKYLEFIIQSNGDIDEDVHIANIVSKIHKTQMNFSIQMKGSSCPNYKGQQTQVS